MFDGKRFFPDTGTPIWKMERSSTMLAVWLPEPLTVAIWMLKSLTTWERWAASAGAGLGKVELICVNFTVLPSRRDLSRPDSSPPAPRRPSGPASFPTRCPSRPR